MYHGGYLKKKSGHQPFKQFLQTVLTFLFLSVHLVFDPG